MSEEEEARTIAAAMRCTVRFESVAIAVLAWADAREIWYVMRGGAGWRSLYDLAQQVAKQEAA